MYQCEHCKYESMYKYNVDRHLVAKHKQLKTETYQAHRNYASHHPYVHPYLSNANQQPNTFPQQTSWMVANNMDYAVETRAPTVMSVGPNGPRAPTTVSVPPLTGGVQQVGSALGVNPTNSLQRGSGIGDQFHRPPQNSIHVGGHANNGAPTTYREPGPTVRAPTTVSVPPHISHHGTVIDETLDEDYQMDYKPTNNEDEDDIWDIIIKIHEELEYIQNLKKQYGKTLPQLNKLEGVLLDEALQEYAALEVKVVDEQYGIDPLENEAEEEGDAGESKDVSEHFLTYIFEIRDVVGDDDLELLELYKLQGSDYKEEEEDVTDIEDLFIEIRDLLESQQNLKIKFRNALHQVKDLDRRWLKHTLKVYAGLEVFVKEEVFGIKKDEEEEETDEEGDSDTDGDENEVEEEVSNGDDEGSVEEESEEVEVGDGDAEGSGDEESEEEEEVVLEPFWNFVFTARNAVDDDIVDIMDKYYKKGVKRVLKEREKEEMELDGDLWGEPEPEDQPQNIVKRVKDVLDITDAFEHSGPCCFETCSQRKIGSIGRMTEYILNNKETLQTHNPRIYEKVYKMLLPIKRSVKKIGDRKVTSHRKRKILQNPQVGRGLLTFMEKLALPTLNSLL